MKIRKNITIDPNIKSWADELMKLRNYTDFSEFLEALIRDEWERRHPVVVDSKYYNRKSERGAERGQISYLNNESAKKQDDSVTAIFETGAAAVQKETGGQSHGTSSKAPPAGKVRYRKAKPKRPS